MVASLSLSTHVCVFVCGRWALTIMTIITHQHKQEETRPMKRAQRGLSRGMVSAVLITAGLLSEVEINTDRVGLPVNPYGSSFTNYITALLVRCCCLMQWNWWTRHVFEREEPPPSQENKICIWLLLHKSMFLTEGRLWLCFIAQVQI